MGKQLDAFNNEGGEIEFSPSADTLEGNVFVKVLTPELQYSLEHNNTDLYISDSFIQQADDWQEVINDIKWQTKDSLTIMEDDGLGSAYYIKIKEKTIERIRYADKKWKHITIQYKYINFTINVQDRNNT
jgi:hypothetical protein